MLLYVFVMCFYCGLSMFSILILEFLWFGLSWFVGFGKGKKRKGTHGEEINKTPTKSARPRLNSMHKINGSRGKRR